jgi:hypothetical protein
VVVEQGTAGALTSRLAPLGAPFVEGLVIPEGGEADLEKSLAGLRAQREAEVGLAVSSQREGSVNRARTVLQLPEGADETVRTYGGPPANAQAWAVHLALDRLRRKLL